MKRVLITIFLLLNFSGCNQESIEETKKLNQDKIKQSNHIIAKKSSLKEDKNLTSNNKEKSIELLKLQDKKQKELIELKINKEKELAKLNAQKEKEVAKLKAQKELEIAKINAQKEQKLKEMELLKIKKEQELQKTQKELEANTSITLAKINANTVVEVQKEKSFLYKIALIVVAILFFIWLLFYYINKFSKRRQERYLKEQELNHKAYMEETKYKHQNISKMLDIIKDEKSDKEIKKELAKLLTHNKKNILEHKKK